MYCLHPRVVVTGKSLLTRQSGCVDLDREAMCSQASRGAADRCGLHDHAGR
jgi:hypothetical protein